MSMLVAARVLVSGTRCRAAGLRMWLKCAHPVSHLRAPACIAPQAGFIRGDEFFVIKMAPGCFSGNAKLQPPLPGNTGVMVVFSQRTGMLRGVLLDEGYLTELRTAAAGALAAKCVLPPHAHGLHMPGAKLTRVSYARVRVIAPTHETPRSPASRNRRLAPRNVTCIGILGSGVQARYQLELLRGVTKCRRVMVWGRTKANLLK